MEQLDKLLQAAILFFVILSTINIEALYTYGAASDM